MVRSTLVMLVMFSLASSISADSNPPVAAAHSAGDYDGTLTCIDAPARAVFREDRDLASAAQGR